MGRKAKLKKQKQKEKYLNKIRNSPIGQLVDYEIIEAMLDSPEIMEIFNLTDEFDQDLSFSDDASRYYSVLEEFASQKVKTSTTIKERTIWTDFPKRCVENARALHIINTNHELGYVPSEIDKTTLEKSAQLALHSIANDVYVPSTLIAD
jgi:hypothetical protein